MKNLLKYSWLFSLVMFSVIFTACEKDTNLIDGVTDLTNTVQYTDQALYEIEERSNSGVNGCFELIFPIAIAFPDATTQTVNDIDELKTAITTWKEANEPVTERPTFVYPIEVLSEDGAIISVSDRAGLRELKEACGGYRGNGPRGHKRKCRDLCFELNFPILIQFPDGTTVEGASRKELKQAARDWKQANPDAAERPTLVFPIEVTMDDGTVVSAASKEELKALKDSCE